MKLTIDKIMKLKSEFGDAFYLLDSLQFKKNYEELKENFSSIYPNFNIAYSYKTNYTPKLCKIVDELGGYAEVVSEMEMELALKIGVNPKNIIWNGPIKNLEKSKEFLLKGGVINIDSYEEFKFIKNIILENEAYIFRIGVRCNYDVKDDVISRFGFDINSLEFKEVISFISLTKNVEFINLQCHFAKRQLEYWEARTRGMLKIIEEIGIIPKRIDLGGGIFGKMDSSLRKQFKYEIPEYKDYAKIVASIFNEYFLLKESKPELIIEPGTALVGDCMKFIATVKTIKNIRGKDFATVLGSQKNISMTGIKPPLEVYSVEKNKIRYENIDIVGYTCIESDVIYKNYCGELSVGDTIVISNCGSYSLVMKPPFILPNFSVIDISGEKIEVIKRSEKFEDLFSTFNF